MPTQSSHLIYAQCALGLEELLFVEFVQMALSPRLVSGGVEARVSAQELAKICLVSRLSESVRIRLKRFGAKDFQALRKELKKLPFRAYLGPESLFSVQVSCKKSRLWHSGAVQERVVDVLTSHVGWKLALGDDAEHAQRVHVRVDDDEVQVSLDAGGAKMHRRGYRRFVEPASLRETLAAALLESADARGDREGKRVVWDPFCGAGTILLEAVHRDSGMLAGDRRSFAFAKWRTHSEEEFEGWKESLGAPGRGLVSVIGSDRSAKAIATTKKNFDALATDAPVTLLEGEAEAIEPQIPEGAWVVTNPPYGKRLEDAAAVNQLTPILAKRPDLKPAICLVGGPARNNIEKSRPALFKTKNGGLSVSARLLSL